MSRPQSKKSQDNLPKLAHVDFRWSVKGESKEQQDVVHKWCISIFKHFIYQLENPKTDGKDNFHYQGYGELTLRRRATAIESLAIQSNGQLNGVRIVPASTEGNIRHIQILITMCCMWRTMATLWYITGRETLKKYSMKTESRVLGPWSDRKIYQGEDLPTSLWDWQQDVKDRCSTVADDRTINYIIDKKGKTGKSKFCKYMGYHHAALTLPWGRTGDILNLVTKLGGKEMYFFDLSRSKPQDWAKDDIAAAMEQIKNGYIVNLKYETGVFYMTPPHVWCFSNNTPNLSSMSADRWKIWEITDTHRLIPVGVRRLKELSGESNRVRGSSPDRSPLR